MRKQVFSNCEKRLALPPAHQGVMLGQALIQGVSVRTTAQRCRIDKNAAFLWHYRFLKQAAWHRALHESGIVEAHETFFLESPKEQRRVPRPARRRGSVGGIRSRQSQKEHH